MMNGKRLEARMREAFGVDPTRLKPGLRWVMEQTGYVPKGPSLMQLPTGYRLFDPALRHAVRVAARQLRTAMYQESRYPGRLGEILDWEEFGDKTASIQPPWGSHFPAEKVIFGMLKALRDEFVPDRFQRKIIRTMRGASDASQSEPPSQPNGRRSRRR